MAGGRNAPAGPGASRMAALRALHPDRKARGYSQKRSASATRIPVSGTVIYSIGKRAKLRRPYSLRPRVGRNLCPLSRAFLFSSGQARGHGAPSGAPGLSVLPRSCCQERGRLSALHGGVFTPAPGRAFFGPLSPRLRLLLRSPFGWPRWARASGKPRRPAVSELLAGGLSAPGRNPGAARVRGVRSIPRPQAPRPAPSSDAS